ncbi:MAG: hypothetical protein GIKADHBN_03280 [Phycisphaerales bacterium]|nr:hypothetical protein [Phycisphaerales bacterium]
MHGTGPVQVEVVPAGETTSAGSSNRSAAVTFPRVAVVIVTWNRKDAVSAVLGALSRQTAPVDRLDVVVVDNASTDGTLDFLRKTWSPERVVENPALHAHEPQFQKPGRDGRGGPNTAGFASLTIVHNHHNHGGCGGFNTGFAYADQVLGAAGIEDLGYVWLVDDDVDLPPDALEQLARVGESDTSIGLVGSRTVDFGDRRTTIETTVYLDRKTGRMCDEPPAHHPLAAAHRSWVSTVGGVRGGSGYTGVREVDVVSACSMLARWSAVKKVGFWDYRYFIYCDDADWCLRMAKAGYRVLLNLDAVVYHTPWHHKLTPVRAYYAQRNVLWMLQKILPLDELRDITWRWMRSVMKQALVAGLHRKLFQAEIMRRSIADMMQGTWGKLLDDGPKAEELIPGLDRIGALRRGATIAVSCPFTDCVHWADELRVLTEDWLRGQGRIGDTPTWIYIVRNDVQDPSSQPGLPERVVYSTRLRSKIRRQLRWLLRGPTALVVFDQACDFPLLTGGFNVHVDRRQPAKAQIEAAGPRRTFGFVFRWIRTAARCTRYRSKLQTYVSATRYG